MFYNLNYMIFMVPAFILMMLTSWYVKSAYNKWSKVPSRSQMTGLQAAQRLISTGGLFGVKIQPVAGNLSDNYDPRNKVLHLSRGVAETASVASLAIAAHELGHAMQDSEDYLPLRFRSAIVPMVNIGSSLGWILIMVGLFLNYTNLAWVGVFAFAGGALFALATLPVELNASNRARKLLTDAGLINTPEEMKGVGNVLNAAALTYVAGLVTALLQLLYFVNLVGGRRRS
ncbi:MAG: zinc metallopeptidase [Chloroflexota bacterium]